tara:strand:+ start:236 stop:502 length:267 start_codon:yes stop_codon:yes gene_type:complete
MSTVVVAQVESAPRPDRTSTHHSPRRSPVPLCAPRTQLLYLEAQSVDKPIFMYINSPGGVVTAGLAIYDTMQYVKPPIATLCVGQVCA